MTRGMPSTCWSEVLYREKKCKKTYYTQAPTHHEVFKIRRDAVADERKNKSYRFTFFANIGPSKDMPKHRGLKASHSSPALSATGAPLTGGECDRFKISRDENRYVSRYPDGSLK